MRISRLRIASGLAMISFALIPCSCGPIEHATELRQAQSKMEQATGQRPEWQPDAPLHELRFENDNERVLSLEQAIGLALANNRALRADLEVIGQAKADLVQAGLWSNPMLNVMLRLPDAGGRADLEFGIVKDFADLWLIPSRKQAAQAMLQQKLLSVTDTAVGLVNEIKTAYHTLQYQERAIQLQQENIGILRQAIEVAQVRLRSGATNQLDVNLLEGRRLEVELELLQIQNEYRVTQQTLLRFMGVSNATIDWRTVPLAQSGQENLPGEEALIDWGLDRRFDVMAAGWEVDAALAEFQQQRLRLIQSLGMGISGERMARRGPPGRKILADTARASVARGNLAAPEIEPRSARRRERSREITLVLGPSLDVPLPIFDQNQAQVFKAQHRARELHERYEELAQRTTEEIRTALTMRRLAEDRRKLYENSLMPVQESSLQVARRAYQSGQEEVLTVLLAQQSLLTTQLGHAAALRDMAISTASLERRLGGRLPGPSELAAVEQQKEQTPTTQSAPSTRE